MKERFISTFQSYWENILERTPEITLGFVLLLFFIFIGVFIRKLIENRLKKKVQDRILLVFIGRAVLLIFSIIGIVVFLKQVGLGSAAGGLLAGAGVSALILGFAFKDLGENFLAGFFLAFSRPFSSGDIIEINTLVGRVKEMTLRNTHIRTFDGRDIYVPNALLIKNPLTNYTKDGLMRHEFVIGMDYNININEATKLILTTLNAQENITSGESLNPFVTIEKFASSTINLKIFFWINTHDFLGSIYELKSKVMQAVVEALIAKGFGMPADIFELKIYQENNPIPISIKNFDSMMDFNNRKL
ncbi:mechanosensitive ion channel family protein [Marivirga sp.]|uniref:mechanosensitive ion channel family protein n=1 Tax=Marivirga sp. TaxID=2018662 RepID=UPI002D8074F0|nr:mechanosensitive ion channel domain-containing protein [Marivirga sp.]HET8859966.1 mechanosensitive ion channel domain-containing protein [Marivirga sp.]